MRKFLTKPIRNDDEHNAALERFEQLIDAPEETPEAYERDVLAILIEKYEEETIFIPLPNPIEAIKFRLEQAGLTRKALEPILGGKTRVSEILAGKRELTIQMARGLHTQLGIPAESLLNTSQSQDARPSKFEWNRFPVVEMQKNGAFDRWDLMEVKENPEQALGKLVQYIGGEQALPQMLLRTGAWSRKNAKLDDYALRGWCLQVLAKARDVKVEKFDHTKFTPEVLRELVQLSARKDGPVAAQKRLKELDVILVSVKHLKNTYLDGAAFITNDGRAVIGLTFRYNRLDNFWFALLHELGHLVLHLKDTPGDFMADDLTLRGSNADSKEEGEADRFAEEALLPGFDLDQQDTITALGVVQYAQLNEISPAIVAGRIQHTKKNYRLFASLLGHGQVTLG